MTRMAGHKISDDGTGIVCTAPPNAACRTRPDCDTEGWDDRGCNAHEQRHPNTPGHDCWAIEWINGTGLLGVTCDDDPDPTIHPGCAVVLTWQGIDAGITWAYPHRREEDT